MQLTGIILCGGKSSRMGEDKGLIKYMTKQLIEYPLEVVKQITSDIYLNTSNKHYEKFGYPLIPDIINELGPIGGIYSVMKTLKARDYFIISCDLPHVSVLLANKILEYASRYEIVVYKTAEHHVQPLFGYYSSRVVNNIEKQINSKNYKLIDLLEISNTCYIDISEQLLSVELFKNINTKKDVK